MKYKNLILSVLMLMAGTVSGWSQDRNNDDGVIKLDGGTNQYNAVPGQVIVKFKDSSPVTSAVLKRGAVVTSVSGVDKVLAGYKGIAMERILPNETVKRTLRSAVAPNGQTIQENNLNKFYLIKAANADSLNTQNLIKELKATNEVEFAEPNYIVFLLGAPDGPVIHETAAVKADATDASYVLNEPAYEQNPLFSQQWGLTATHLVDLWKVAKPTGKRPVIAILDTGVDITHPDLAPNIWTNPNESADNGYDDDNNGFADDLHGWDFVNQRAEVSDDNSHGTHCAGIAAASGDDAIGIVGANPKALIMPVKVFQSNGKADVATIIKGINYAAKNGATVISMSFGSYSNSIALEQALATAYQTSLLVAAAGNDGYHIDPRCCPIAGHKIYDKPLFPAAYTFVLGVEATQEDGSLASFSNSDCDGPVYSQYDEDKLYNYELKAPGVGIISTVPGGDYRSYSGTSMAAPLVAGAASLLQSSKQYTSKEVLFGDLIQTLGNNVDFLAAYNAKAIPQLNIVSVELNDTISGDKDLRADAGEIVQLYPVIRSVWGATSDVKIKIEFAEFEDNKTAEIVTGETSLGDPLSAYAKVKAQNPLVLKINKDVVDGRNINFVVKTWYGDHEGEIWQDYTIKVENGVELKGMLTTNTTLYPNVHYIITDNLAIPKGVTLTIKPGTVLKFKDGVGMSCVGEINALGTKDSLIVFTKTDLGTGWKGITFNPSDTLSYCVFESIVRGWSDINLNGTFSDCIFRNDQFRVINMQYCKMYKSNFFQNTFFKEGYINLNDCPNDNLKLINFCNNSDTEHLFIFYTYNGSEYKPQMSNIFSNKTYSLFLDVNSPAIYHLENPNYLGSSIASIAHKGIFDFDTPQSGVYGKYDLSNMPTRPYAEAHGLVWKVEVNGKDAQDNFDEIPPLGVGKQEFKVYFNRPMNKNIIPTVAMGVRPPYTQTAINENGSWNEAGDIYTAYHTVGYQTGDGLNRIYVSGAMDNENFEIPFENQRFNVVVSAAGSMSTGFEATPGLGKVDLTWEAPAEVNLDDVLGYNMYRYTMKGDTLSSDTVMINKKLITEVKYTDYEVTPGQRYYYLYKILRTSLTETDASQVVSTTPLTAQKGDSNGSLSVDVADVVTTVNYMTDKNPQPFIFDAADVNTDANINILDVVGTVNIINKPVTSQSMIASTAEYGIENGKLYVQSPVSMSGVQVRLKGTKDTDVITPLSSTNGFERIAQWQDNNNYLFLAYSLSGKEIPAGKTELLEIGSAGISEVVLSDINGRNIETRSVVTGLTLPTAEKATLKAYPNPFRESVTIPYSVQANGQARVRIHITDITGRELMRYARIVPESGKYTYTWAPGSSVSSGTYLYTIYINGEKVISDKLIKE